MLSEKKKYFLEIPRNEGIWETDLSLPTTEAREMGKLM